MQVNKERRGLVGVKDKEGGVNVSLYIGLYGQFTPNHLTPVPPLTPVPTWVGWMNWVT